MKNIRECMRVVGQHILEDAEIIEIPEAGTLSITIVCKIKPDGIHSVEYTFERVKPRVMTIKRIET